MNQHANRLHVITRGTLGLALLASVYGTGSAGAACQSGRFLVQDEPLVAADSGPSPDAVVVLGSSVSIRSGCSQVAGKVRARGDRTKVRARWASCNDPRRKVLLSAEIDQDCHMTGVLVMKRPRSTRRFEATRSLCGDGVLDPDAEACDDGNQIAGDGCETDCTASPAPPTTSPTTSSTSTTTTTSTTSTTHIDPPPPCPDGSPFYEPPPPPPNTDLPPDTELPPDHEVPPGCPPELC